MADNKTNHSSDLGRFLYKALIFLVVVILVPLFPSRAPEFVNQSFFTRGWELLHLLFVGIAVCYGLFSRRNDDATDQKTGSSTKLEDPQSYVSMFLEVPSVFDDEVETLHGSGDGARVQSWSSQYSRGEPVVVMAADESTGKVSRSVRTKPLLLPVRSLKSRVLDSEVAEDIGDENGVRDGILCRSNSSRVSSDGGEESVVLRSPIPWRSRSGRMVIREEAEVKGLDRPKGPDDNAFRPSGYTHLVSPEVTEEGLVRKSYYKSQPPPAPPLPPHKSPLMYSSTRENGTGKEFKRLVSDKDLGSRASEGKDSRSVREELMRRASSRSLGAKLESLPIVGKSVRTAKAGDSLSGLKAPKDAQDENKWKDVMEAPKERVEQPLKDIAAVPLFKLSDAKEEEKEVPEDIVTVESDHDSESEDEDKVSETLSSFKREEPQPVENSEPDFGPDVDKKADEFIAKFREQIRLQRIESIKRSTYQATRKIT